MEMEDDRYDYPTPQTVTISEDSRDTAEKSSFEQFFSLAQRLVSVPKAELNETTKASRSAPRK